MHKICDSFSVFDINQETKRAAKVDILSKSTKFAALNYK